MNSQDDLRMCIKHNTQYVETIYTWKGKSFIAGCTKCHLEIVEEPREEDANKKKTLKQKNNKNKIATSFRDSGIPPRYTTRTVDNFKVVTEHQRKSLFTVKNYIDNFDHVIEEGSSMIMTGGVGTGKTHLASAIGNSFIKKGKDVAFMNISAMFRKIRETYQANSRRTEREVINDLSKVDLLILDEIGIQKGGDNEKNLIFEVLNERYCHFKPTVLISNLSVSDMQKYIGMRVMDRLKEGGGKLAVFDGPSYRTQVLQDKKLPSLSESEY